MIFVYDGSQLVEPTSIGIASNPMPVELYSIVQQAVRRLELRTGRRLQISVGARQTEEPKAEAPPANTAYDPTRTQIVSEQHDDVRSIVLQTAEGLPLQRLRFRARGKTHELLQCWSSPIAREDRRRQLLKLYLRREVGRAEQIRIRADARPQQLLNVLWPALRAYSDRCTVGDAPLEARVAGILAPAVRQKRNELLMAAEPLLMRHLREREAVAAGLRENPTLSSEAYAALLRYMQALADLPEQSGFPFHITWPEPPAGLPAHDRISPPTRGVSAPFASGQPGHVAIRSH